LYLNMLHLQDHLYNHYNLKYQNTH
jgi:hypothetical protein